MQAICSVDELKSMQEAAIRNFEIKHLESSDKSYVFVAMAPECVAFGADKVYAAFEKEIKAQGLTNKVELVETMFVQDPAKYGVNAIVYPSQTFYAHLDESMIADLVKAQFIESGIYEAAHEELKVVEDTELKAPKDKEIRVVLGKSGLIDPNNIEDYFNFDGYKALSKVLLEMSEEEVIEEVLASGLKGRGGAGFPTGLKWRFARGSKSDEKYVICNADEGDPGAFMNRRVLESDPHAVLEGMMIAAYAIGSKQGYVYCRAEYPIAVKRFENAICQARSLGLLGKNILGTGFDFDLEVRMGAGAFVCGEETALMASIEGKRGEPRPRPPFPAQKGLWQQPSNINNVETYANVPQIINKGAEWYASMGNENAAGTKTFALAGDLVNTGLIEVPFGITLREIIYDIGQGIKDGNEFKAVQTGGPMGGCLVEEHLDLPMDYKNLAEAGSIMGSGGLVVMDNKTCMVDMARFFMEFTQEESCGKCVPCRVGTRRILEIHERICEGKGTMEDLDTLELLCEQVKQDSLCGLGQGAPNPVVSMLAHFRDEYEAHILEKKCPAKVCRSLISFRIDEDNCTGCTLCARNCPTGAISGDRREVHVIDPEICIKCGICEQVCNFDAVIVS